MERDLLNAIDAFAAEEGCKSRSVAVRLALRRYFLQIGKLPTWLT